MNGVLEQWRNRLLLELYSVYSGAPVLPTISTEDEGGEGTDKGMATPPPFPHSTSWPAKNHPDLYHYEGLRSSVVSASEFQSEDPGFEPLASQGEEHAAVFRQCTCRQSLQTQTDGGRSSVLKESRNWQIRGTWVRSPGGAE